MLKTFTLLLLLSASACSQLVFDGTKNQHVTHGTVCSVYDGTPSTYLANEFTVDMWVKISPTMGFGYAGSVGYGGAHAWLVGVVRSGDKYSITGNIASLQNNTYVPVSFSSEPTISANVWFLLTLELKNNVITVFKDGVVQSQTPFAGQRIAAFASSDPQGGELFVGGSDHINWTGSIGSIRVFEGAGIYGGTSFIPDVSFADTKYIAGTSTLVRSNLLADYAQCGSIIYDASNGYNGRKHSGALRSAVYGLGGWRFNAFPLPECVKDKTHPRFGLQQTIPDPPQAPPMSATIFDSFNRADSTYLNGIPSLGSTEVNGQQWNNSAHFGIQDGHAVYLAPYYYSSALVEGYSEGKAEIARVGNTMSGLRFRSVDDNNGYAAFTSNNHLYVMKITNGSNKILASAPAGNWSKISVEYRGNTIHAIAGNADITITDVTFNTATKVGLYAFAPMYPSKFENFTVWK